MSKIIEIGPLVGNVADQTFIFRFDVAHEKAKTDKLTIDLVAKGSDSIPKTDPTFTRPRQFPKKKNR